MSRREDHRLACQWRAQAERHERARQAAEGQLAQTQQTIDGFRVTVPPDLRAELDRFAVNSAGLEALQANAARYGQMASTARRNARNLARLAAMPAAPVPLPAPRRDPRPRGAGRPAARRAAGSRSGTDPGDDDPHPPRPPRSGRLAHVSALLGRFLAELRS